MTEKIIGTPEAWESGPLGKDPAFAIALSPEEHASESAAIDAAFGLKPISIRMEVELLDNLKAIANHRGLGYQPLIRQVLHRWVDSELKQIALESMDKGEEKEVRVSCRTLQQTLPKAA